MYLNVARTSIGRKGQLCLLAVGTLLTRVHDNERFVGALGPLELNPCDLETQKTPKGPAYIDLKHVSSGAICLVSEKKDALVLTDPHRVLR